MCDVEDAHSNASSTDDLVAELLDPDDRPRNVWRVVERPKVQPNQEREANKEESSSKVKVEQQYDIDNQQETAARHSDDDLDEADYHRTLERGVKQEIDRVSNSSDRIASQDNNNDEYPYKHHNADVNIAYSDKSREGPELENSRDGPSEVKLDETDKRHSRSRRERSRDRSPSSRHRGSHRHHRDRSDDRDKDRARRDRSHHRDRVQDRSHGRTRERSHDRTRERSRSSGRDRRGDKDRHRSRRDRSSERRGHGSSRRSSHRDRRRSSSGSRTRRHDRSRSNSQSPLTKRNSRTILIMQLSPRVDSRDLEEFFSDIGKVREVRFIMDSKTRKHKGIAYIEFEDAASAAKAYEMNGRDFRGAPMVIQSAQLDRSSRHGDWYSSSSSVNHTSSHQSSRSQLPTNSYRVYAGGLHLGLTEDMLRSVFEPFGPILRLELMRDRVTNVSRGYAFITFANIEDGEDAVEKLDGLELGGKPMKVSKSTDKSVGRYL